LGRLAHREAALHRSRRLLRILWRDPELALRHAHTVLRELRHEGRAHTGGSELALDLALRVGRLLEGEDVLDEDLVILDPVDLGDVDDLKGSVLNSGAREVML